jgi:8-oxo-dGTP diphosphatase
VKKIPTTIPVVAVALIDGEGRVLMQQRRHAAEHGGLWEFPGGKVEAGESLEESLCREIAEELGLNLATGALDPLSFASAPGQPYVILLYTCRNWAGMPQCLDGEAIAWFAPEMIADLAMPPLDVPLARALIEHLKRGN